MKKLRVDLKPILKQLDFFTKRYVQSEYSGEHISFFRHKGIEFEDFKQFVPGDDASLIDWKASLRNGELLIRQYSQMKNLNVFILLDVSNSMVYSSVDKLKCEYAAELALAVAHYFTKSGDSVGLVMFTDHVVKYIPPNLGTRQVSTIMNTIVQANLYGGNFNLTAVLGYIDNFVRRGAVVVIISDFIGLSGKWDAALNIITAKADMMGLIVRDPQDMNLPSKIGQALVSDPYTSQTVLVDVEEAKLQYGHDAQERLDEIQKVLRKNRVESLLLPTNESFVNPLIKFFSRRRSLWH